MAFHLPYIVSTLKLGRNHVIGNGKKGQSDLRI